MLGLFCTRALLNTTTLPNKAVVWIVISLCFFYGISDEYHQSFVVGRVAEWGDVVADTIGGSIGVLIYPFLRRRCLTYFRKK